MTPQEGLSQQGPAIVTAPGPRPDLVALLAARHSTPPRRLVAPAPDEAALDQLLAATLSSPAHGGLRNFRIIRIAESARPALCDLFEAAEREWNPDATADSLARAREKAGHAPMLLLFIVRAYADHPDVPVIEQHASAGAALGSLLHAAQALGFGAMAVSGHKLATTTFRQAFALEAHEQALCFVALGTPAGPPRSRERPEPRSILSEWPQPGLLPDAKDAP